MKRISIIACVGLLAILLVYKLLPLLIQSLDVAPTDNVELLHEYVDSSRRDPQLAKIVFLGLKPGELYSSKEVIRIVVTGSQVLEGDNLISVQRLCAYLNTITDKSGDRFVVVNLRQHTTFSEIIPVLDECRKSRVRAVLLNYYLLPDVD